MNVCRSKSCGILKVVEQALVGTVLKDFDLHRRIFVGVDCSTKFTGVVALHVDQHNTISVDHSELIEMSSVSNSKEEVLHLRFEQMLRSFELLKRKFPAHTKWEITVEDKIIIPGNTKGSIGSHTLAEVIVCARIAAKQIFAVVPTKTSPLTARAGLGLNNMSKGNTRSNTKESVVSLVTSFSPSLLDPIPANGKNDVADAFLLAICGLRQAIERELVLDLSVQKHFSACHAAHLLLKSPKTPLHAMIDQQLNQRMGKWVDELWLSKHFPNK